MNLKIKKKEFSFYNHYLFNMVCYILQGEAHSDDGELDDVRMLFFVMHFKKKFCFTSHCEHKYISFEL